jgi:exodeoxyribonuclease VII small subunit
MNESAAPARDEPAETDVSSLTFEAAFAALEQAVAQLEAGELALDDSVALYERGVALAERCDELLSAAELRIQQLAAEGEAAAGIEA